MTGLANPRGTHPCSGRDGLFLEQRGESAADRHSRERRARAVCSTCVVRIDCLVHAIEQREIGAVWGGLNDDERLVYARAAVTAS